MNPRHADLKILGLLAALVLVVAPAGVHAQSDNRGQEFALAFMENSGTQNASLFISGDVPTSGVVEVPGLMFSAPFDVVPGAVTTISVPIDSVVTGSDIIADLGVRVTANDEVVVYGINQLKATTDAFLGLPTDVLGTDYIVVAWNENVSARLPRTDPTDKPSEFAVVGVEDSTTVTVVPSIDTGSRLAGVPYEVMLDANQVYQLQSDDSLEDLTGTRISADRPVALFAGGVCIDVPDEVGFCDHLVEQIPPTSAWGRSFLAVSLATRTGGDLFRIMARDDETDVTLDGVPLATLDGGAFHDIDLDSNSTHRIETTGPALVMQYAKGSRADGEASDPFMMMIPPTEEFLSHYTVTTPAFEPVEFDNFLNVVVQSTDAGACTLDDGPFQEVFAGIPATEYSFVREPVGIGAHTLACPSPFGVYAYGWALNDSYGYPGGLQLPAPSTGLEPLEVGSGISGGGSLSAGGLRVTHGFNLDCHADEPPSRLEVNWGRNSFHLESLTMGFCADDPEISEGQPAVGFDTHVGQGVGRYNGTPDAIATWKIQDAGEPGKNDSIQIEIRDDKGNVVLDVSGTLRSGNHQAHP